MTDYVKPPKYFPTDEEVQELIRLREQYWPSLATRLDEETTATWMRRLRGMESEPGMLKRAIDAIADRGDKFPPHLPVVLRRHSELCIEAARSSKQETPPTTAPVEKPDVTFRAAYKASGMWNWTDDNERLAVLGAFNDEFGWPKRYHFIARVREQVAEARAVLEKQGRLEAVLERYQQLREGKDVPPLRPPVEIPEEPTGGPGGDSSPPQDMAEVVRDMGTDGEAF